MRIRTYPHFDAALTSEHAELLVNDVGAVASHAFHPFIEYSERWTKFSVKGVQGSEKSRPIKYSARRDSCIFSHYRELLRAVYETELSKRGIGDSILAYRRIPKVGSLGNKSSIEFAKESFDKICELQNCLVFALDISKFFDTIDHEKLKKVWADLLQLERLPHDHYRVFRAITNYSSVNREELYKVLGFIGAKQVNGRLVAGYLIDRIPLQVCSGQEFRKSSSADPNEQTGSWNTTRISHFGRSSKYVLARFRHATSQRSYKARRSLSPLL